MLLIQFKFAIQCNLYKSYLLKLIHCEICIIYPLICDLYVLPIYLIRLLYYNTMYWFELLKLNKKRKLCLNARANFFFKYTESQKLNLENLLYIQLTLQVYEPIYFDKIELSEKEIRIASFAP